MAAISPQTAARFAQFERREYWNSLGDLAFNALFVALVVGAVVLLAIVFLPSEREAIAKRAHGECGDFKVMLARIRARIGMLAAMLMLIVCAISSQYRIDQQRGLVSDPNGAYLPFIEKRFEESIEKIAAERGQEAALKAQYMYLPSASTVRHMSLNNSGIAADYVWLTSLQYVSTAFRRGQKFELLEQFYDRTLELQPEWVGALRQAGKVLSALTQDRDKIERFYIRAIEKNPDSWRLCEDAGRVFVVVPGGKQLKLQREYAYRAVKWFERALKQPTFPPERRASLSYLIAQLSLETASAEFYKAAANMQWEIAHDEKNPLALKEHAAQSWLSAHSLWQASVLQTEVDNFRKKNDADPATLKTIVEAIPSGQKYFGRDAFGLPFDYDPKSRRVTSRGENARRAIQSASVINVHISFFRGEHNRAPKDLAELRDFIEKIYKPPHPPASFVVLEAIGIENGDDVTLDPTVSPLGQWNYSAKDGRIILPDYCNTNELFLKNIKRVLEAKNPMELF